MKLSFTKQAGASGVQVLAQAETSPSDPRRSLGLIYSSIGDLRPFMEGEDELEEMVPGGGDRLSFVLAGPLALERASLWASELEREFAWSVAYYARKASGRSTEDIERDSLPPYRMEYIYEGVPYPDIPSLQKAMAESDMA